MDGQDDRATFGTYITTIENDAFGTRNIEWPKLRPSYGGQQHHRRLDQQQHPRAARLYGEWGNGRGQIEHRQFYVCAFDLLGHFQCED